MNENYKAVAQAVKSINGKGKTLWSNMVAFAVSASTNGADSLKENFKTEEKLALSEMKLEMGKNSTYKVAKSVLVRATEMGIAIVHPDGKARGKSEIEAEIAAGKEVKSPIEKFKATMTTATTQAGKLDAKDVLVAATLVKDLYEKLSGQLELRAAA